MTPKQRLAARLKAKRVKDRAKAQARRARAALRKRKRVEKRRLKAAPRLALKDWASAVKTRDGGKCVVCGATALLNAHHLLPKERYPEFKLEPVNGIALCPRHHKFDRYSAHRNPIWFALWLRANRPEQFKWCKLNAGSIDIA